MAVAAGYRQLMRRIPYRRLVLGAIAVVAVAQIGVDWVLTMNGHHVPAWVAYVDADVLAIEFWFVIEAHLARRMLRRRGSTPVNRDFHPGE
jgi:hypothetical protein